MQNAAQEGAGGEHDAAGLEYIPRAGGNSIEPAGSVAVQAGGFGFGDREVGLGREQRLDGVAVELAVGLSARAAHRRAFATIEQFEMDAGSVCRFAHQPVQRVDLADQMALADAADCGVAGHLAQPVAAVGEQERCRTGAGGGGGGLAAGMAAADDDDIVGHGRVIAK